MDPRRISRRRRPSSSGCTIQACTPHPLPDWFLPACLRVNEKSLSGMIIPESEGKEQKNNRKTILPIDREGEEAYDASINQRGREVPAVSEGVQGAVNSETAAAGEVGNGLLRALVNGREAQ